MFTALRGQVTAGQLGITWSLRLCCQVQTLYYFPSGNCSAESAFEVQFFCLFHYVWSVCKIQSNFVLSFRVESVCEAQALLVLLFHVVSTQCTHFLFLSFHGVCLSVHTFCLCHFMRSVSVYTLLVSIISWGLSVYTLLVSVISWDLSQCTHFFLSGLGFEPLCKLYTRPLCVTTWSQSVQFRDFFVSLHIESVCKVQTFSLLSVISWGQYQCTHILFLTFHGISLSVQSQTPFNGLSANLRVSSVSLHGISL